MRLPIVVHLRAAHARAGVAEAAMDVRRRRARERVAGGDRRRVRVLVDDRARVGCRREGRRRVPHLADGGRLSLALAEDV